MVPPASHRASRRPRGTRVRAGALSLASPTGLLPSAVEPSSSPRLAIASARGLGSPPTHAPQPPPRNGCRLGTRSVWARPRSLAATWGFSFDFSSSGYLDVSVPRVSPHALGHGDAVSRAGFPHSDIPGSMPASGSPGLIAAGRVLPRLSAPRHPPCALSPVYTLCSCQCPPRARWR